MTDLVLTHSNTLEKGVQKRFVPLTLEVGPYMLIVSLVVFIALMSVITLVFSTKEVTKGYLLKDLEAKRDVLLRDHEVKTMHLAQVQSLDAVKNSSKVQKMLRPDQIVFMRGDTSVAVK